MISPAEALGWLILGALAGIGLHDWWVKVRPGGLIDQKAERKRHEAERRRWSFYYDDTVCAIYRDDVLMWEGHTRKLCARVVPKRQSRRDGTR